KVAPGVVAFGLTVPVTPAVTIDQVPLAPVGGVLPPSEAVVLPAQMVCGPPADAVGWALMVTLTSAVASVHGAFDTVHLSVIDPVPVACVNVAFGVEAFGEKVPVPPLITDHVPVAPPEGVLPPSPVVVPSAQIVCGPPAEAVGAVLMVIVTSANESAQGEFAIVHRKTIGPVPLVCVNVALPVVAFGLNMPAPPLCTVQVPLPLLGVLPPRPAVVPSAQMV